MKKIQYIIIIAFISMFYSCTKVIDIDLNDANPQYVIQGVLYAGQHDFIVNISQTTSYFSPSSPAEVKNAQVSLSDENGIAYEMSYLEEGDYLLTSFLAEELMEYTLQVNIGEKEFVASAKVAPFVAIDSIKLDIREDEFENRVENGVKIWFTNHSENNNYYQIESFINSQEPYNNQRMIIGDYEDFESSNNAFIYIDEETENDVVIMIELRTIDEKSYHYFNSLDEQIDGGGGPGGGASPANPKSNWSNGALGYFGTGNSDFASIVWDNTQN
ncbi:DUF4249 domain-containing protein [Lentimicrobium sp. L6]|uniref:DUF4249 family protein n=1 Tax=Lentimicrobium sp. L6 TaxID=2735916 RepID=UPI0015529E2F|nr:DUF4249 family protein [Lentimicrobium sp. L6]NPD83528.1 DUF4249 domain-containing protein [Lentimicrobium sp. L6]